MPNQVLDRLRTDRQSQVDFVDQLLTRVEEDGRDLVDAERANLESARSRITELDAQIEPLLAFEAMRDTHAEATRALGRPGGEVVPANRRALGRDEGPSYRSLGHMVVDAIRAGGFSFREGVPGHGTVLDSEAVGRITRVVANVTTGEVPGVLPEPVVGPVINLIDASRPLISSLGPKSMGGVPGKTFTRPKVTQHTLAGVQTAEKTELPSRQLIIGDVPFTKTTHGGTVNVSRQAIDWTSPSAWQILLEDLANAYALDSEATVAADFVAKADDINAATPVASDDLAGWSTALYAAAALVYDQAKRLPDRIWCSVDIWARLGPMVDQARLVFSPGLGNTSSLTSFSGVVLDVPRVVVPSFPDGTCIIGASTAYEVYEETIGLLSAVEPSILGVEVAYGGYLAYNAVYPEGLAIVSPPAVVP